MADARVLRILLGDVLVGHLTGFQDGKNLFAFDESYINLGPSRPILSLSFNMPGDEETTERKLREVYSSRMKLPPIFSNLLPEGVLREYMVKRLKIHHDHEFDILMALGGSLPGAIRALPAGDLLGWAFQSTASKAIAYRLRRYADALFAVSDRTRLS